MLFLLLSKLLLLLVATTIQYNDDNNSKHKKGIADATFYVSRIKQSHGSCTSTRTFVCYKQYIGRTSIKQHDHSCSNSNPIRNQLQSILASTSSSSSSTNTGNEDILSEKMNPTTTIMTTTSNSSSSTTTQQLSSLISNEQQQQQQQLVEQIQASVEQLKKVLEREYLSFFNPMEREWYSTDVTFIDPLTSFTGIDKYQSNVDMLSGRNLVGNILFGNTNNGDARIMLHTITGGEVIIISTNETTSSSSSSLIHIKEIITRWTLQFKFRALPWKPIPQFSGISKYQLQVVLPPPPPSSSSSSTVRNNNKKLIQIVRQDDYWDSINLIPDGTGKNYQPVDKTIALQHFLSLCTPASILFTAIAASSLEVPYETLRLGRSVSSVNSISSSTTSTSTTNNNNKSKKSFLDGQYEVRRYPSFVAIQIQYNRRDEGFELLGSLTQGLNPLAPTFVTVTESSTKTMMWPLQYTMPKMNSNTKDTTTSSSSSSSRNVETIRQRIVDNCQSNGISTDSNVDTIFQLITIPEKVVVVGRFTEAIVEPVVRNVQTQLLELCTMDGLVVLNNETKEEEDSISASATDLSSSSTTTTTTTTLRTVTFAQHDAIYSMGKRRSEVHVELDPNGHPWGYVK